MLEEDQEAICRMKVDFENLAEMIEKESISNTDCARRMSHYNTVYTAATRVTTNSISTSDSLGYDVDELLYKDFEEMLTRYLLKYRDLSASSEAALFAKVLKVWEHYRILMKWNLNTFAYLSRYFIVNCSKVPLEEVALKIFLEQVLRKHAPAVGRVTQELLQKERNGESVNRDNIRGSIEMLSSTSFEKGREIYVEHFLNPYLSASRTHYGNLLLQWSKLNTPGEFLANVEKSLTEEKARCRYYFSLDDEKEITSCVDGILLDSSLTEEKLLTCNSDFAAALRSRDTFYLERYYSVFERSKKGLNVLATLLRDHIVREGEEKLRQHDCEENFIDFKLCLADVIKLQEDCVQLLSHAFKADRTLSEAVKDGLEKVFCGSIYVSKDSASNTRCISVSELFAYYLDAIIQSQEIIPEGKLEEKLSPLKYITEIDTFIAHSRDLLAHRILFPRRKFDETLERTVVQLIENFLGMQNTSSLEDMLDDVDNSQDFKEVEKQLGVSGNKPFELSVLVLKKSVWPSRIQGEEFTPPRLIGQTLQGFRKFYLERTSGRVLAWSHSSSVGDISAAFKSGTHIFSMSGLQCWVMLAFNRSKILTPSAMMTSFSVSLDDLKPVLFALVKCSLLHRESDSQTLQVHDKFFVNEDFCSKWKKIRIPMAISRITTSHSETIAKEVDEERKPAVDACLVRIMKSHRIISHADLVEGCHQKLPPFFQTDQKLIKQRIEELLRKGYVERDQQTAGVYRLYIEDVPVLFPYEYIYPEQLEYMTELKKGLDQGGHLTLEMPSGTGKTVTLLSLLVGYIHHHAQEKRKVVYCTRTVEEMTKTMGELRKLLKYWESEGESSRSLRGLCLTAKKNLCIEASVSSQLNPDELDAECRNITAPWQRDRRCVYFDALDSTAPELPPGAYSVDDLKRFGEEHKVCPYYLVRKALRVADILVHSYLYIVDPVVAEVTKEYMNENTILVMDEGHNVDDVCIEAMSLIITKKDAIQAKENVNQLNAAVDHMKATNRQNLQNEYDRLVNGLAMAELARSVQDNSTSIHVPSIPQDIAEEAIPGSLRQANHFLAFIKRLVDFTHRIVGRISRTYVADPLTFLTKVKEECAVDIRHLRYLTERLKALMNTLQITNSHKYRNVALIAQMYMTLSTYYTDDRHEKPGFVVVCEAYDPTRPAIPDPVIRLVCVDASLALREAFSKYKSVILTSGTLSPLDIYPKILDFTPVIAKSFQMTLSRKCIAPVIVTRSSESVNITTEEITSSYSVRLNPAAQETVSLAYEELLRGLAKTVPDGIVCFFTGYQYMGEVLLGWHKSGFLKELAQYKLIFVETQGVEETSLALYNYRKACDIGRGAMFMAIARGKIAEGIDFDRHYGRAVVMFGVPFLPPNDEPLRQRIDWMETCLGIPGNEYRNFDAMRQASQCVGRVLRNKTDYGMMFLVDRRFALNDKRKKLPTWIQQSLKENTNVSVDAAVAVARSFFKEMAQPWEHKRDLGTTLFSLETLSRKGFLQPTTPVMRLAPAAVSPSEGADVVHDEGEPIKAIREPEQRKRPRV